jgi:hypothetical protein
LLIFKGKPHTETVVLNNVPKMFYIQVLQCIPALKKHLDRAVGFIPHSRRYVGIQRNWESLRKCPVACGSLAKWLLDTNTDHCRDLDGMAAIEINGYVQTSNSACPETVCNNSFWNDIRSVNSYHLFTYQIRKLVHESTGAGSDIGWLESHK